MGVVIFTKDDAKYRKGDFYPMYGEMTVSPTVKDRTYIYHIKAFSEADAIYWAKVVPHRLVIVTDKLPKLTKASEDCVIIDQTIKMGDDKDYSRSIRAALCWTDRDRARVALAPIPLPLVNAFIKVNVNDIGLGRLIAKCRYTLHSNYLMAAIAYGINPVKDFKWPKKQNKNSYIVPEGVRQTDKHMGVIIENDVLVSNGIRTNDISELPASLPKRKQTVIEWV
jgi:hypothetical protein